MREAVRGPLRKAREHLGIEIPILRLVLRAEDAALGGSVKTFLQFFWIDAPKKLFECGARGGERARILRLVLTEVLSNPFASPPPHPTVRPPPTPTFPASPSTP